MDGVWIMIIAVVAIGVGSDVVNNWMKMRLKHRELKLEEAKLAADQLLRSDELNAKILKMDDFGLSPVEIASLSESVRQLREEVSQLKQEISNRAI